jgi:predicted permease
VLTVFLDVIFPIFLVAVAAAAFQRWRRLPIGPVSQLTLYLFAPALIFSGLVEEHPAGGVSLLIVAAIILTTIAVGLTSVVATKLFRHPRPMQSAFMLATVFPNAGNMGLPVLILAFGDAGLAMGVVVFVTHASLGWSLGLFLASRSQLNALEAFKQVLKTPTLYALLAGLAVLATGWEVPSVIAKPTSLLGQAAIPTMLVVLGFQLAAGVTLDDLPSMTAALVVRLLVAAPLAYGVTVLLGLDGVAQQAVIVVAAMPPAVFTTVLATEFRARPQFVTATVVTGTLLSLVTLTGVITVVQKTLG